MAYFDPVNYVNSVGYAAVPPRGGAAAVGRIVRQSVTPAVNSERCFICVISGSGGGSDPVWVLNRGARTFDGGITWQECTGAPAVNGDLTNTPNWNVVKGQAVSLGQIIKRNNEVSFQICSKDGTAGTGVEPLFGDVAGTPTGDGTAIWTSLGPVNNFAKGGAPHARIVNAGTDPWFRSNGIIYVGDNHAELQTPSIAFGTSYPSQSEYHIGKMLCHDHAGSYPPTALTTGAVVATNSEISLNAGGSFYYYGIQFKAGVGATSGMRILIQPQGGGNRQNWARFDHCLFWLAAPSNGSFLFPCGGYAFVTVFDNTSLRLAAGGDRAIITKARFIWRNSTVFAPGSAMPATLLQMGNAVQNHMDVVFENCDLTPFSGTLYSNDIWWQGSVIIKDSKLHPAMSVPTNVGYVGTIAEYIRSDSGTATYRSDRYEYAGSDTTEISVIRVGGAVDRAGQQQSRKLVTNEAALFVRPLPGKQMAVWGTDGSPITMTVHGLAASLPKNDEIWLELEYLADPASTLGTIITTSKPTVLSPATVVNSDDSSWASAPAGWVPFKLTASVTPAHPGHIHVRPMAAKPRTTFFIDPMVVLS